MKNDMSVTFYVLFFIFTIMFTVFLYRRNKFVKSLPHGPKALPIFGNIFQFDKFDGRKTFVNWHKQFGPIFTIWIGIKPVIIVSGYDLLQELFVKRADEFAGRPNSFLFEHFTHGK